MQVKDVLQKSTLFLRGKGFESARLDSELLIAEALRWERMKLYLNYEYPLSEAELASCRELIRRRALGEPVAYILGRKDFYNHSFLVSPAVLIPRPETEQIVEETLKWMSENDATQVADFGTGSGCIGLSVLAENRAARLLAIDISPQAISVAQENAIKLGVNERTSFMTADLMALNAQLVLSRAGGQVDAVIANPPYIAEGDPDLHANVARFEPHQALFAKDEGLAMIAGWARLAGEILRPGGFLMFEIGHMQGQAAHDIFLRARAFDAVRVVKDLSGRDRFVRAVRASNGSSNG